MTFFRNETLQLVTATYAEILIVHFGNIRLDTFKHLCIVNGLVSITVEDLTRSTQGITIPKKDGKIRLHEMRETLVSLAIESLLQTIKGQIIKIYGCVNYSLHGCMKLDELIVMMNNAMLARANHNRVFVDPVLFQRDR